VGSHASPMVCQAPRRVGRCRRAPTSCSRTASPASDSSTVNAPKWFEIVRARRRLRRADCPRDGCIAARTFASQANRDNAPDAARPHRHQRDLPRAHTSTCRSTAPCSPSPVADESWRVHCRCHRARGRCSGGWHDLYIVMGVGQRARQRTSGSCAPRGLESFEWVPGWSLGSSRFSRSSRRGLALTPLSQTAASSVAPLRAPRSSPAFPTDLGLAVAWLGKRHDGRDVSRDPVGCRARDRHRGVSRYRARGLHRAVPVVRRVSSAPRSTAAALIMRFRRQLRSTSRASCAGSDRGCGS